MRNHRLAGPRDVAPGLSHVAGRVGDEQHDAKAFGQELLDRPDHGLCVVERALLFGVAGLCCAAFSTAAEHGLPGSTRR